MTTATAERPKTRTPDQNPAPQTSNLSDVAAVLPAEPKAKMLVMDLTAVTEARVHPMLVGTTITDYEFRPREAKALDPAVAVKFLAHDNFKLCDADGNILAWSNVPKQPHQLEAGQQFRLADDETVARYDELHSNAIKIRALQMPGGERFADSRDRAAMIQFIKDAAEERRKKNVGREALLGGATDLEEFTPEPVNDGAFFGDEF